MVAETSVINFREHRDSGKLGDQERGLLEFLRSNPHKNFSRNEIHQAAGVPLASVCGRINALVKLGLPDERPQRACQVTGKTITPVRAAREIKPTTERESTHGIS